jgi:hypothetical protein
LPIAKKNNSELENLAPKKIYIFSIYCHCCLKGFFNSLLHDRVLLKLHALSDAKNLNLKKPLTPCYAKTTKQNGHLLQL